MLKHKKNQIKNKIRYMSFTYNVFFYVKKYIINFNFQKNNNKIYYFMVLHIKIKLVKHI